jgi:hypothetical protein
VREVLGILAVLLVVVAGYAEVPFGGKTFSTSLQAPGARVCGTEGTDACLNGVPDDPRFDHGASAWALEPWVNVVHRDLAQRDLPLWNPYQGAGAPLAANMQSGVFDPLLLAAHLHPTPLTQDLSFLVALMLIGVGAYFAARMLRLQILAAVVCGSAYGLSGWFFAYSNNSWFRVYLYLPLLIGLIEWVLRSSRRLPIALLALSVTGMLVVGMPEPAFIALVAAGLYALARIFIGERSGEWWSAAIRLAGAGAIGIALAGPLLLLFKEYVPLSLNAHSGLGNKAPETDSATFFLNWMMPRISPTIAKDPRYSMNYSGSRNWVGAGVMVLAVLGLLSSRASKRAHAVWPLTVVGAVVGLQIYGGGLVGWTRHLPVWSQTLWPAFGTPVLALVLALLAGVGVQAVAERDVRRRHVFAAAGTVLALALLAIVVADHPLAFGTNGFFAGGWPFAVIAILLVVLVCTVVPLRRWAPILLVVIVLAELVVIAPRGFYAPRKDPYPPSALATYLTDHTGDGSRIFSTDGVLFPDTANAYGLSDVRLLDALYVDRYWRYLRTFVSHGIRDRLTATGPGETAPAVAGNPMFDLLGVRYLLYRDKFGTGPPSWSGTQYQRVFHSDGVTVYENTRVAPRAFVAPRVKRVKDTDAALAALTHGERSHFPDGSTQVRNTDTRQTAVVESASPVKGGAPRCTEPLDSARVVSLSSDRVEVDVNSRCGGVLVLSDTYYPGWKATVEGNDVAVHPVDVAFRGVSIPAGASHVVFRYEPSSFRAGLLLFAAGAVALLVLLVTGVRASGWWRRRRTRPSSRAADPGELLT